MKTYILPIIHIFRSKFRVIQYIEEEKQPPLKSLLSIYYCDILLDYIHAEEFFFIILFDFGGKYKIFISLNNIILVSIILNPTTNTLLLLPLYLFSQPLLFFPYPSCPFINYIHHDIVGNEMFIQIFNLV